MAGSMARPRLLHVEGRDDTFSIIHVMQSHGVDFDPKPWPVELKEIGGIEELLDGMEIAISAATGNMIGFVLDADAPLQDRWDAVRARMKEVDVPIPTTPPREGFIGESRKYKARVGVWLMPDNEHDGKLENFLQELIADDDSLIGHAETVTDQAKSMGAAFSDADRVKAVIHSWLAWQREPGYPFGKAIRSRYFQPDRPAGKRFAKWFRELYRIPTD